MTSDGLTVGDVMQLMDRCAKVIAAGPTRGGRLAWLTYLLEALESELDDSAEFECLAHLLRQEIDGRLDVGRW